jgi:hypothetical protein
MEARVNEVAMAKEFQPEIVRARYDRLTIYEISEDELELLVRGAPDSVLLNFAIFLLSAAVSFLTALLTTTIDSDRLFVVFVIFTVAGFVIGSIMMALWWRGRRSVSSLIESIRNRLPPGGNQKQGGT